MKPAIIEPKLREQYDHKSIEEIETLIDECLENYNHNREMFIKGLYYLFRTNRFKENPIYKDNDFFEFLALKYRITPTRWNEEKTLYLKFAKETKMLGEGKAHQVLKKCGAINAPKAFREIEERGVEDYDAIMEQHARPQPEKKSTIDVISFQKVMEENIELKRENVDVIERDVKVISAQQKQIEKLKETIKELQTRIASLELQLKTIRNGEPYAPKTTETVFSYERS